MKPSYLLIRSVLVLFATLATASAQQSTSHLSFDQLTLRAGIIFSGTVQKVDSDASVVHVTFSVDDAIRGVFSGQTIMLNEWKGSTSAIARYRTGERLLVFFHTPSPNGLTSPVGGNAGIVRFSDSENVQLTTQQTLALKRSARVRSVLPGADDAMNTLRVPAADLIRALRLVSSSQ